MNGIIAGVLSGCGLLSVRAHAQLITEAGAFSYKSAEEMNWSPCMWHGMVVLNGACDC